MSICNGNSKFKSFIVTSCEISEEELMKFKEKKMPIFFMDREDCYYDEIGGFHDGAISWNPNGVYCGECTLTSCSGCPSRDIKSAGVLE